MPRRKKGKGKRGVRCLGGEQVPVCLPAALLVREQGAHASMPRAEEGRGLSEVHADQIVPPLAAWIHYYY